jgi:hypothetical protein
MARNSAIIWSGRGLKALAGGIVQLSQAPKKQRSRKVLSHHKDHSVASYCNVGRAAERTSSHMLKYLSCSNADDLQGRDLMISCSQEEPCRRIHYLLRTPYAVYLLDPGPRGLVTIVQFNRTTRKRCIIPCTPHFLHAVTCDVRSFPHHKLSPP